MCVCVIRLLSENVNDIKSQLFENIKPSYVICNCKKFNNTFAHMLLDWLKCTVGKHNQVRFHWNRGYDNGPEVKDEEIDSSDLLNFLPLHLRICEN